MLNSFQHPLRRRCTWSRSAMDAEPKAGAGKHVEHDDSTETQSKLAVKRDAWCRGNPSQLSPSSGPGGGCYDAPMNPSADHCRLIVPLLRERDGLETTVLLSKARTLRVFNIAWGDDLGDDFEHITGNISPNVEGASVDLFFTDEIASIADPATGRTLWMADGVPSVR